MISNSLNKKTVLRFVIAFLVSGVISSIVAWIIVAIKKDSPYLYFFNVLIAVMAILSVLIGWIYGNRLNYQYRRESKKYNGPLPIEVINNILDTRTPFILNGLVLITIYSLSELIISLV